MGTRAFFAITVPDLEEAEAHYRALFGMDVITREGHDADGAFGQLPHDRGWEDARAAGIDLWMLGLRHGDFVLALFRAGAPVETPPPPAGRVPLYAGFTMEPHELDALPERAAAAGARIEKDGDERVIRDRYGIGWQLSTAADDFVGNGDSRGMWLVA